MTVRQPSPGTLFVLGEMAFKATQDSEREEVSAGGHRLAWGPGAAPGPTLGAGSPLWQTSPWSTPLCHQVY